MKKIELINSLKPVLIDDKDFELVSQYKWRLHAGKDKHYYAVVYVKCRPILMHRLIMQPGKGKVVDHINGDGLDNTRKNLRVCTQSQNIMGKKMQKNNTSGYRGVSLRTKGKSIGKYEACIRLNGKKIHLGRYKTAEEASSAYIIANKKYFKEFSIFI